MNRERFAQLLEAYGADLKRFPAAERTDAEAYLAAHAAEAAAALAEARALDAMLEAAREAPASNPALASQIMNTAPRRHVRAASFDRRTGWALAACAVFGVALGYGGGLLAPAVQDPDSVILAALEATFVASGWSGDGE